MEAPLSSSASSTPPWPKGSSSSLHLSVNCRRNVDGGRFHPSIVMPSQHSGSCRGLMLLLLKAISFFLLIACPQMLRFKQRVFFLLARFPVDWCTTAVKSDLPSTPSLAWTAFAWLGRISTLFAALPVISSANVLPQMSISVDEPISSSLAARWLHTHRRTVATSRH